MTEPGYEAQFEAMFEVMGLRRLEAAVLGEVLRREQATLGQIAGALGADRSAVSTTVVGLQAKGLLDRLPDRRPVVVFVHADLVMTAQRMLDRARAEAAEVAAAASATARALDEAGAALLGPGGLLPAAAERRAQRARPAIELATALPWEKRRHVDRKGGVSHDQVLSSWLPGTSLNLRCVARVLVVPGQVDPWRLSGMRPGSEVRRSAEPLPELLVLDDDRVGVLASGTEGLRWAWSRDRRHVRAAQQLFALWWESAEPCYVVPEPPRAPEPGLDEWDDLEADEPSDGVEDDRVLGERG